MHAVLNGVGMSSRHNLWSREPFLRLAGCSAALLGGMSMWWLFHTARRGGPIDPTPAQAIMAAVGFLGLSIGLPLIVLGVHVFDQVQLSERWKRRTLIEAGERPHESMAAIGPAQTT